jgi:hypothetical protein
MRAQIRSWRAGVVLAFIAGGAVLAAQAIRGPSSSASPYVLPAAPGIVSKAILTVGDAVGGYRLVGIPDGLGAFDNNDGTFTLLMNHEIRDTLGVPRAHGAKGAFVSTWVIRKDDLAVIHGSDLIQNVATWNVATGTWNAPGKGVAMSRLCSADLPPVSALYDATTGAGYSGRVFFNGEEVSTSQEGRVFAHMMDGTSYELPALGKASWENILAHSDTGLRTVVVGLDDSSGPVNGQVYVYVGEKTAAPNPADAAGLTNGTLFGLKVAGFPIEPDTGIPDETPFTLHSFGDATSMTGAAIESASNLNGVTAFKRPEDGAWDPSSRNDFYFVTTATFITPSRLWRLRFVEAAHPEFGGTISMVLDGTEEHHMFDNLAIDRRGQIFLQEDPGVPADDPNYLAAIWRYTIETDTLTLVARHDPERFTKDLPNFLTQDEESSGIIDASDILGEGWFLLDVQTPYNIGDDELVNGGQLLAMHVPPGKKQLGSAEVTFRRARGVPY